MALSAPLPPAYVLTPEESPYRPADLAPSLSELAAATLTDLRADLALLATGSPSPALLAIAEELHGTAAHLVQLAERFTVEAAG